MNSKKLARRDFFKLGGLTLVGSVLTCFGLNSLASRSIREETGVPTLAEFVYGEANTAGERLLVVYATYAGSTMEVAQAIGEELGKRGFRVDVKPVVHTLDLAGYQAVLVGSAVQYGAWLPEAVAFVEANQQELRNKRVALFSVHIQNLEDDPESRAARLAYLETVRPFVRAELEGFFPGRFNKRGAVLLLPGLIASIVPEMDLRDWKLIRGWAQNVFA